MLLAPVVQIGKIGKRLSPDIRSKTLGESIWRSVGDFRNVAIHDYDALDLEIAWDVVPREVPELGLAVKAYLDDAGFSPETCEDTEDEIIANAKRLSDL